MNTAEFLTISAAIVPDRTAVVGPNERVSYQELQSRVNKLAQALQARGVQKGQNVGVMAVNSPEFVEIYYAVAALGATFVPLNFRAKAEELTYMIDSTDVTTLFIAERYWSIWEGISSSLPNVKNVITMDFERDGNENLTAVRNSGEDIPVFAETDDSDPTLIIFT
ncbi:MAG: AMP-binding protein, partial [Dehalococcoidia bacterium]|nr:AMP-binding protein [Dehalococcoidia bacterium]